MKGLIGRWLDNSPRETMFCALTGGICLILSITKALPALPADPAWIAIIICGAPILVGAFTGVVFEHDIKADLLVSLALIASVVCGEYFAAGEVALIMQIGSLLEDYTSAKAEKSLQKLIDLTPRMARLITEDGEEEVEVEKVLPGDTLRVLSGEMIPVDGTLISGYGSVDQSVMTGESLPVEVSEGDSVMSGSVNASGAFVMRCDRAADDSSLQRMIALTEKARDDRAPIVDAADRWATWLVVFAVASALLTWAVTGEFLRAVTLLVVFCPCAFILATPTAVLAGTGNLAKHGIIIKSGGSLQRLAGIGTVAFDKTGTLTEGSLSVENVNSVSDEYTDEDVLGLAAAAEAMSEHPIGKAIRRSAKEKGVKVPASSGFRIDTASGVSADVEGKRVMVGRAGYLSDNGADISKLEKLSGEEKRTDLTEVCVSVDGMTAGYLQLSDRMKDNAPEAVGMLRDRGMKIAVITGDKEETAKKTLEGLGDAEIHAELMPSDKMDLIRKFSAENGRVCMVGDGVNDAPALSLADAAVAMGNIGSDIAVEASDAVLVGDDLLMLPYMFDMAEAVMKKIRTNLTASVIINLSAMILSAAGILSPVSGALWHNIGSVFVVVNAALLLRK